MEGALVEDFPGAPILSLSRTFTGIQVRWLGGGVAQGTPLEPVFREDTGHSSAHYGSISNHQADFRVPFLFVLATGEARVSFPDVSFRGGKEDWLSAGAEAERSLKAQLDLKLETRAGLSLANETH